MKALLPILIIIIIIGGFFYFKSMEKTGTPTAVDISTVEIEGEEVSNDFEGRYVFDTEQSSAKWTGSKKIIKDYFDTGAISIKSGNVSFEGGSISQGEIVFNMTSITTTSTGKGDGEDNLTTHLKSDDFFGVETYPEATYEVTGSEKTTDGFMLSGNLTLKGKTAPLNIPVKTAMQNGNVVMAGIAEVNRAQFDVKFGSESFFDNLGDNVINDIFTLEFNIVARP